MIQVQEQLNELAQKLYQHEGRRIRPLYPWVLVRVLPKDQAVRGLWLPQTQNKIFYEGIVLEVWKPFVQLFGLGESDGDGGTRYDEVLMRSALQPGDHVMFPHYEGLPDAVRGLPEEYRLVREINKRDPKCEVMGKLEYEQSVRERLWPLMGDTNVDALLEQFHVIPKDQTYKTISGK